MGSRPAWAVLAGFALVLFGLTTLQKRWVLAESLHPSDLPAILVRMEPAGYPARSAAGRRLRLGS